MSNFRILVNGSTIFESASRVDASKAHRRAFQDAEWGSKIEYLQGSDYRVCGTIVKRYPDPEEKHDNKVDLGFGPKFFKRERFFNRFWGLCQEEWAKLNLEPVPTPVLDNGWPVAGRYPMGGIVDGLSWIESGVTSTYTISGDIHLLTAEHCRCMARAEGRYQLSLAEDDEFASALRIRIHLDSHPENHHP